jgi:hypothetical protein
MAEGCLRIGIPCPVRTQVRYLYPVLAAGTAAVFVGVRPGVVAGCWDTLGAGGSQAVVAQQGLAVVDLWDLAYPDRIAIHSMAFVVLVAPAAVGVVVTLRFPMFRSIYSILLDLFFDVCQFCVQSIAYSSHSGNVMKYAGIDRIPISLFPKMWLCYTNVAFWGMKAN